MARSREALGGRYWYIPRAGGWMERKQKRGEETERGEEGKERYGSWGHQEGIKTWNDGMGRLIHCMVGMRDGDESRMM